MLTGRYWSEGCELQYAGNAGDIGDEHVGVLGAVGPWDTCCVFAGLTGDGDTGGAICGCMGGGGDQGGAQWTTVEGEQGRE